MSVLIKQILLVLFWITNSIPIQAICDSLEEDQKKFRES